MQKNEFEERIIDYIENNLEGRELSDFEKAMNDNPELKVMVSEYSFLTKTEKSVQTEEYIPSPGFSHKMMDIIYKEKPSILEVIINSFRKPPVWLGAATLAAILLIVTKPVKIKRSEISEVPAISKFEFDPFIISASSSDLSSFGNKQESLQLKSGGPLLTYETLAMSENEIVTGLAVTVPPDFNNEKPALRDISLNIQVNNQLAKNLTIPAGKERIIDPLPSEKFILVKGKDMHLNGSFSVISILKLNKPGSSQESLLTAELSFTNTATGKPEKVSIDIKAEDINKNVSNASKPLQDFYFAKTGRPKVFDHKSNSQYDENRFKNLAESLRSN